MSTAKRPLAVGDRVHVYGPAWGHNHEGRMISFKAEITTVLDPCTLEVRAKDENLYFVHPKQIRRLVSKPRRRIYLDAKDVERLTRSPSFDMLTFGVSRKDRGPFRMEFVEVRRKKK